MPDCETFCEAHRRTPLVQATLGPRPRWRQAIVSSLESDRADCGPPRVPALCSAQCYSARQRTAAGGRQTNVAFDQSYQSAGSPTIDSEYTLYNLGILRVSYTWNARRKNGTAHNLIPACLPVMSSAHETSKEILQPRWTQHQQKNA